MSKSVDSQLQTMISNMPEKTGKSLDGWYECIASAGLEKHGDILKLLKLTHGISHGFANTISLLYREQLAGGPPSDEQMLEQQYSGAKSALRPIYDSIVAEVCRFASDVDIAVKKTYVSLRRNKQFAIVQASTKTRIDLGLNMKGAPPTERLETDSVFGGMCSHRVRVSSTSDIDQELLAWLKKAYAES